MKALKKLIPAAAMLVLCAAMMTTATFAWFNMNTSVAVTGGTTSVTAPTNIQMAKVANRETNTALTYLGKLDYSDVTGTTLTPVTVSGTTSLTWAATQAATNAGVATTAPATVTPNADGVVGTGNDAIRYFRRYDMNIKNIGGNPIDVALSDSVKLSNLLGGNATVDAEGKITDNGLFKSVCMMILVGEVSSTDYGVAGTTRTFTVGAAPSVVWDDGSPMLSTTSTDATATSLISGTVEVGQSFIRLAAQQNVDVSVIVWLEGNKAACANANVSAAAISFDLDFEFTTLIETNTDEGESN